ncbi:MAG: S24 family peptidase [Methyloglobulus sp.]
MNEKIERAMELAGYSQTTLAAAMGCSPQAVQQWISGLTKPKAIKKLANFLGVSVDYLMDDAIDEVVTTNVTRNVAAIDGESGLVPLISWVKAGEWCEAEAGDPEGWERCPVRHGKRTYALRVVGDSMTAPYPGKKSYPEGAVIYVDPDVEPRSGLRVVAKIPGSNEATFKEYRIEGGKHYLKPLNPQYPIIEMTSDMHICGVVIGKFEGE